MRCLFQKVHPVILVSVLAFVLCITACSEKTEAPSAKETTKAAPSTTAETPVKSADNQSVKPESGWQEAAYEGFRFSLPKEWKGNSDTGIWCPADQNLNMGRPAISLHCGGIPVLSGSFEKKLKFYYGDVPVTLKTLKKCGMNAKIVEITKGQRKHLALIMEETGSGMKILNFIDCQAPADKFTKYRPTFEKILNSVQCK